VKTGDIPGISVSRAAVIQLSRWGCFLGAAALAALATRYE